MTYRGLLLIKSGACLAGAPLLLLVPRWFYHLVGASPDTITFPARAYGAALAGTVLLTWLARDAEAPDARRAILLQLLVYDAIGVVITVLALATHEVNATAWAILAVYLFFTLGAAQVLRRGQQP